MSRLTIGTHSAPRSADADECMSLYGKGGTVYCLAFSPDGKFIATCMEDTTTIMWDTSAGSARYTLKSASSYPTLPAGKSPTACVIFSPNGGVVATTINDNNATLWNTYDGSLNHTLLKHSDLVDSIVFSHDGLRVATCAVDGIAIVWDTNTGVGMHAFFEENFGDRLQIAFCPKTHILATFSTNRCVLWNAEGKVKHDLSKSWFKDKEVSALAFHPDGSMFITGEDNGRVTLWGDSNGYVVRPKQAFVEHHTRVSVVTFSPGDGSTFASCSNDGVVIIRDAKDESFPIKITLTGLGVILNMMFSFDGCMIVTCSDQGTATVWNTVDGSITKTCTGDVWAVEFSPNGSTLATGMNDGTTMLWRLMPAAPT